MNIFPKGYNKMEKESQFFMLVVPVRKTDFLAIDLDSWECWSVTRHLTSLLHSTKTRDAGNVLPLSSAPSKSQAKGPR